MVKCVFRLHLIETNYSVIIVLNTFRCRFLYNGGTFLPKRVVNKFLILKVNVLRLTEGISPVITTIMAAPLYVSGDSPQRSWLRHCATSRKVAGSIPYGVTGVFH